MNIDFIKNCFNAFYSVVLNILDKAPYLCYFVISAFLTALIFNIIHALMGGK